MCVHTPGTASKIADALSRRFAPGGGWRRPVDLDGGPEIHPMRTDAAFFCAAPQAACRRR
jgi:hypothetical protein